MDFVLVFLFYAFCNFYTAQIKKLRHEKCSKNLIIFVHNRHSYYNCVEVVALCVIHSKWFNQLMKTDLII